MMRPTTVLVLSLLCGFSAATPTTQATISKDVNDMKYFYFPEADQKVEIAYNNANSLESSNIKAGVKTTIIIDGFLSDSTSPASLLLSASYIARGGENVIVLDWGRLSGSGLTLGNPLATASAYLTVLGNVGPAGQRVAEFINFLKVNKQIDFSDVTLVGHSLGAHISAAAGVSARNNYGTLISHIVGLDPAGSFLGMGVAADKRLRKGDATFVDMYHSNRGTLGDNTHDTGDVNVYINGGADQPGCEEADSSGFVGYCSHSYSWKYYDQGFGSDLRGCPCNGDAECTCTTCKYECGNSVVVGPNISSSTRGRVHASLGELP